MRDPSIHCKLSDLSKVLKSLHPKLFNDALVEDIAKELRKVSVDNRSVIVSNDKLKKDLSKRLQSTKGDATLLADIIYSVRIKLKHKGVRKINMANREWLQVKQLANLCNQFCEDFNLSTREGFIKYIELGLGKIQSMRSYIGKLINMYETISQEYESVSNLKEDDSPNYTMELHDAFVNKIADRTGLYEPFNEKPEKMLCFYLARVMCDNMGVDYQTFIDAQFDAFNWCQSIPTPESLTTDKAKERLNKYMYSKGLSLNTSSKEKTDWSFLKKK